MANEITGIAGIPSATDRRIYLGTPVINGRAIYRSFHYILDKIKKKLSGWMASTLTFAGRITLVKSVLNTIPFFVMQTLKMPVALCQEIDKICRCFIWGHDGDTRKVHLVSWDTLCRPKEFGGLGIRQMRNLEPGCFG
ncbi:hypothetical protein DITRI_Ditri11bG0078600 [Diplodiscus trichospermus]